MIGAEPDSNFLGQRIDERHPRLISAILMGLKEKRGALRRKGENRISDTEPQNLEAEKSLGSSRVYCVKMRIDLEEVTVSRQACRLLRFDILRFDVLYSILFSRSSDRSLQSLQRIPQSQVD